MPEVAEAPIQSPYVSKMPRMMVKSSDHEFIRKAHSEFKNAWEASESEFRMMFNMWKMVFAGEGDQWEYEAWKYKRQRGMRAGQYNMIGPKVDTYAGSIIADTYDLRFDPMDGVRNSGIKALENAYFTDKELCEYDVHWNLFISDAVIHLGVLECMFGKDYDRRGSILFKRQLPGRWIFDPYWKTDFDRDCRRGWKHGHYTVDGLFEQFKRLPMTPQLDGIINNLKKTGMSWTERRIDEYNVAEPEFLNAFQVIWAYWVEVLNTKRLVYYDEAGNPTPFPVTDDNEKLERFAQQSGIVDWQESVDVIPYEDKICHCAAFCPELSPYKLYEYGKPEIQVQGLPTIQLTMHRDPSGRNKGVPQDLVDPQKDINYNKSKIQEYLAAALGGAVIYDKTKMPNDEDQKDFEANRNDTIRNFGIEGDPTKFMTNVVSAKPDNALVQQVNESVDFMDRISGKSAAMESKTQSSGEPAALFEMKLKVDKIGDLPVLNRVKRARIRKGEMYILQAPISYSGVERTFTSKDGKHEATFNEPVTMPDGTPAIRNKVEDIPRSSVTINEAPDNLTRMRRTQAELSAIVKSIPAEYQEPMAIAIGELMKTTNLPEDKKQQLDEAMQILIVKARMQTMTEMSGMDTQMANNALMGTQIKMQLQQLMQSLGGGAPQEQVPEQLSPEGGPEQEQVPQQVSIEENSPMMEQAAPEQLTPPV